MTVQPRISGNVNYAYRVYTSPARSTGGTDFFRIACSVQWLFHNFRGTLVTVPLYLWFHAWKQEEITKGQSKQVRTLADNNHVFGAQ